MDKNKAIELKDVEEGFAPVRNWKTHLMVIAQWLFFTPPAPQSIWAAPLRAWRL